MKVSNLIGNFLIVIALSVGISVTSQAEGLAAHFLYQPQYAERHYPSTEIAPKGMTSFQIVNGSTVVDGWQKINPRSVSPIVIFFYGNGMNMESVALSMLPTLLNYSQYDYVFFDYPGYGFSKGQMSEKGLVHAGDLVLSYVRRIAPSRKIVIWGHSLGSAVAIQVAADSLHTKSPIHRLILMAPWTSFVAMAKLKAHVGFMATILTIGEHYYSLRAAKKIKASHQIDTLVIQGTNDQVIPIAMGKKVYETLGSTHSEWLPVKGATHNSLLSTSILDLWPPIVQFIQNGVNGTSY